jgi:SAM-dependent methyltransferase
MGGRHFEEDADFVASGVASVARLEGHGLEPRHRLLDWGCGAGRLAVGLKERWGNAGSYIGLDVQRPLISWARRHLGGEGFEFVFVDVENERYNPTGSADGAIPIGDASVDVVHAYSVFSHMRGADAARYLHEISRVVRGDGFAFFTAFVEDDVPHEMENPRDYGPLAWSGRLHCVRFDRTYFDSLIENAGLSVSVFEHGRDTDGQSAYVVRHAD